MRYIRVVVEALGQYGTMLVIQCDTSRFRAGNNNGFKCNSCQTFVVFPRWSTAVVIISLFDHWTVVRDAKAHELMHDCRLRTPRASENPWVPIV